MQNSTSSTKFQNAKIKQNEQIFFEENKEDKVEGLEDYLQFLENYDNQSLNGLNTEIWRYLNNKYNILESIIKIKRIIKFKFFYLNFFKKSLFFALVQISFEHF